MKSLKRTSIVMVIFLILSFSAGLFAQTPMVSAEDEVIALTYNIWKAEMNKNMTGMNKYLSDDYTEFNPTYSTRIDGKKIECHAIRDDKHEWWNNSSS